MCLWGAVFPLTRAQSAEPCARSVVLSHRTAHVKCLWTSATLRSYEIEGLPGTGCPIFNIGSSAQEC
eukprot:3138635-Rhodomonas_salina.4